MRALLPLLLCLLLAGCGTAFDSEQRLICRQAIPALNPPGSRIVIESEGPAPRPSLLRVTYLVEPPGRTQWRRTVDCLFSREGGAPGRALIGLAADGVPMSDASFYLLRRFYLEDREAPPADPGAGGTDALPRLSPTTAHALQQAASALPSAAVYALLASAYALIYGLTGRIILAFGEFAALGALAAVAAVTATMTLTAATPLAGLLLAFMVAIAVCALHGFALGRAVLRPLGRTSGQQMLIATLGLSIALSEYLSLTQGARTRWLPPVLNEPWALARSGNFLVTVTPIGIALTATGLAAAGGLVLYLRRSAYGRAWRAVADDAGTAALFGVDARSVLERAVMLACALCGVAGVIVTAIYGGMGFAGGFTLGLKALVAAVLGGIGSVAGACLGGLAIAAFEAAWSATLPIEQRDLAVYSLLAVVLILRPGGFFGDGQLSPRQV